MRLKIIGLIWFLMLTLYPVSAQSTAVYETVSCRQFSFYSLQDVECGYLTVPEDYSQPDSKQIRLAVAIFRHPDGNPEPDPIIYLEGGPGGSPLKAANEARLQLYEPLFAANRDIIVFDQRGVGFSEPSLECPDYNPLFRDLLDLEIEEQTLTRAEAESRLNDSLITCGATLSAEYDLSQYNSANSARDIESLRVALGYEQVNLWGISYGTRLALTMLRDYPANIRSVLLDSAYPLEVNLFTDTPANGLRALNALFDGCAAAIQCDIAFPNLREAYVATMDELRNQPVSLYSVIVDDFVFQRLTFQALYSSSVIPFLPSDIHNGSEGDIARYALARMRSGLQRDTVSIGMNYAVQCQEELAFIERGAIQAAYAAQAELQGVVASGVNLEAAFDICAGFNVGIAPTIENEPVMSDIPALIFAGHFDPITPPAWGQRVATNLANSFYLEFPTLAHAVSGADACPQGIAAAFFIEPTTMPDTTCIDMLELDFIGTEAELPDSAPRL
jgi:pimeloyl-ACP methyl ester carboxylesterase